MGPEQLLGKTDSDAEEEELGPSRIAATGSALHDPLDRADIRRVSAVHELADGDLTAVLEAVLRRDEERQGDEQAHVDGGLQDERRRECAREPLQRGECRKGQPADCEQRHRLATASWAQQAPFVPGDRTDSPCQRERDLGSPSDAVTAGGSCPPRLESAVARRRSAAWHFTSLRGRAALSSPLQNAGKPERALHGFE